MFSFQDTTALVVGAAGGIGRALAVEFSQRGASVVAADIDEAGATETARLIVDAGGKALGVACDITDEQSVQSALESAEAFLGEIDIVANAVGVLLSGHPEDIPLAEWQRIFQINVLGAARLNEKLLPQMLERGRGYIVNTASVAGLYPFAITRIPYAASKAALISMSQNLAIYLKPKGINVSCLCPGPTLTAIGGRSNDWTEGLRMVGPSRDYKLMTALESAGIFCDGMELERVIINSQPEVTLDLMQRAAASPDHFIYERIGQYASGDDGLPAVDFSDPAIIKALQGED